MLSEPASDGQSGPRWEARLIEASDEALRFGVRMVLREPSPATVAAGFKGRMSLTELGPADVLEAMIDHLLGEGS